MDKQEMQRLKTKYESALKTLASRIEIIYNLLEQESYFNPIEHIKKRLKSNASIHNKLIKKGYPITEQSIIENIHDIAGIRIVCSFLSDIERIERLIQEDKVIKIVDRKDYITTPKETGYSSLHLIVLVPTPILKSEGKEDEELYTEDVEVEIQIRTIAMDMWASLEHKLLYKSKKTFPEDLKELMQKYTHITRNIDRFMEEIIMKNEDITRNNDKNTKITEEEISVIDKIPRTKYDMARRVIEGKISDLNDELEITKKFNPIEHIKTRIKTPISTIIKLKKLNYEISEENISQHIHDFVGIRIVCSFLSDLYEIKDIIENDPTIKIIKKKDYITNPKDNGYRSYHINAIVPVNMIGKIEYVEVEIQIRTIAMDMWASLERKISYKKDIEIPALILDELKTISDIIYETDNRINNIVNQKESGKPKYLSLTRKKGTYV